MVNACMNNRTGTETGIKFPIIMNQNQKNE